MIYRNIIFFILFQFITSPSFSQEKGVLSLSLNVISSQQPVNEASIKFTRNQEEVELNVTQSNGRYTTVVPFGNDYQISVGKENLYAKIIKVDTHLPDKYRKAFYYLKIAIELFGAYDTTVNQQTLNQPYAEVKFDPLASNFVISYNKKLKKADEKAKIIEKAASKDKPKTWNDTIDAEKKKAQLALEEKIENDKKTALLETEKRNQELAEIKAANILLEEEQKRKNDAEKEKIKQEKIKIEKQQQEALTAKLEKEKTEAETKEKALKEAEKQRRLSEDEKARVEAQTKALQEKTRLEHEEEIEHEKKLAFIESEKRNQELAAIKAANILLEEEQKRKNDAEEQKRKQEKVEIEEQQQKELTAATAEEKEAIKAKEKAQKEAKELQRIKEVKEDSALALTKELKDKAKLELKIKEQEKARLDSIENNKQYLARKKAKEEELAAKAAFEDGLKVKQKELDQEKNNGLKEKDLALLIEEYKAYPKGHWETLPSFKIFRFVKKENETTFTLYRKSIYSFGEYYFRNNVSITKARFEKDTKIID